MGRGVRAHVNVVGYNRRVEVNRKYLLKTWVRVILFCGFAFLWMVVISLAGLRRGDYTPIIAVAGSAVVAITIGVWSRQKGLLLFQEPTPDRAIAYYHRWAKSTSKLNTLALTTFQSALAAALYGQFDRAREELASMNWRTLPPIFQGYEVYIHSLLAIFEVKDYSRALRLAQEARDLCDAPEKFPGVKKSLVALDANVAVCELLVGKNDSGILDRLDKASKELPGVSAAIPAWALAGYHTRVGQSAEAEKYLAVVRRLLPHCTMLHDPRV